MDIMRTREAPGTNRRTRYVKNPAAQGLAEQVTPRPLDHAAIAELCARIDALPVIDDRTPDEILGYDEFGIPR